MRVPVVTGPSVAQDPLRIPAVNLDAGPEVFGAGIARGINDLGKVAQEEALRQKREAIGLDAMTQIAAAQTAVDELKQEALQKGMAEVVDPAFVKTYSERSGKVWQDAGAASKSKEARLVVGQAASRDHVAFMDTIHGHVAKETDRYREFQGKSLIEGAITSVARDPMNEKGVAAAMADSAAAIKLVWGSSLTPKELKAEQEKNASSINAARLSSLDAQHRSGEFLALFEEVKGTLDAKQRERFDAVAVATSDLEKEQAATDAIFEKHPNDPALAYAEARKLSGAMEENVTRALSTRFDQADAADRAQQQADLDAAWGVYIQHGTTNAIPRDLYSRVMAKNPLAIKAMQDDATRKAKEAASGPEATDFKAYGDWLMLPESEKLLPQNDPRSALAGKVSEVQMERAIESVRDVRNAMVGVNRAGAKKAGTPLDRQTVDSMISDAAKLARIKRPEAVAGFHSYVRDRVDDLSASKGERATREDVQQIIDEALIKGENVGGAMFGFVDPNIRQYQAKPGETFRPFDATTAPKTEGIPADELALIDAAIRGKGMTPTDELRRQYFAWRHAQDGAKP